jgi:hypothetical protein
MMDILSVPSGVLGSTPTRPGLPNPACPAIVRRNECACPLCASVQLGSKPFYQGVSGKDTDDEARGVPINGNGWDVERAMLVNEFRTGVHVALLDRQAKLVRSVRNLNPVRTADGLRPCRGEVDERHRASLVPRTDEAPRSPTTSAASSDTGRAVRRLQNCERGRWTAPSGILDEVR